jgi:thiol-disulfide isomerase/thioredoxin
MSEKRALVRAPEFPEGMQWLNTDQPLRLADLRGKVVLLDFWTYCCINCMHILPDLAYLEHKYRNELVVIGVHAAKFANEREADNIRQAILRYEIEHPVVNDNRFQIWQHYTARSWPTLIVIKPDGYVLGYLSGEGNREILVKVIDELIDEARRANILDSTPLPFALEKDRCLNDVLSFPGKVEADAASHRLFIADSNHHRIVIADLEGEVLDVAGSGELGRDDGDFGTASFNHPQGMVLEGDHLYVADTENHLLRRIDLKARTVTTIAGTGEQARAYNVPGTGTQVALNSPWDLCLLGTELFIAMAGPHQIWVMHLDTGYLEPYAGSAREDIIDDTRLQAAMAQPSGVTSDGEQLFVADSETSAIRAVTLGLNGRVQTILGEGLFEFGDQDGVGKENVRLQHPLGVAYHDGILYVADTYNHKIKKVGPATAASATYLGTGQPGLRDGDNPAFFEPGGVSVAAGKLYIADTNNHAVRVADLVTGVVSTLPLKGLAIPNAVSGFSETSFGPEEVIDVAVQIVRAGEPGKLHIDLNLPSGYHFNPQAPFTCRVAVSGTGLTVAEADQQIRTMAPERILPLAIPFQAAPGGHEAKLVIDLTFYYCREGDTGVCAIQSVRWNVPIRIAETRAAAMLIVSYTAVAPETQNQLTLDSACHVKG